MAKRMAHDETILVYLMLMKTSCLFLIFSQHHHNSMLAIVLSMYARLDPLLRERAGLPPDQAGRKDGDASRDRRRGCSREEGGLVDLLVSVCEVK